MYLTLGLILSALLVFGVYKLYKSSTKKVDNTGKTTGGKVFDINNNVKEK
jgi:hypothetical protein